MLPAPTPHRLMQRNTALASLFSPASGANPLAMIVAALDQAKEGYLVMTPDGDLEAGRITYVNRVFCQITGYAADELRGRSPALLYTPEIEDTLRREVRPHLEKHDSFVRELSLLTKRGEAAWIELQIVPVDLPPHVARHWVWIVRDISERKRVEQHLEQMANFSRFNPNPIYEIAETGEVLYSNEAARRLSASFDLEDPADILPADAARLAQDCLRTGEPIVGREEGRGERTLTWAFFPIPETRVVHCYAGELTERRRLESQLRQAEKLKSIGQLAGGVAHDFNNILTVIHGFSSLLLSKEHADPAVGQQLEQIATAAERARDLTRQLLTFSRRQMMKPTTLDLHAIIREMGQMLTRLLGEQVELCVACRPEEILIEGDRSMIEQIILNLVTNARDAMTRGGLVTVETSVVDIPPDAPLGPEARPGRFARLSARDTGCGMDARTLSRIFEPFFTTKETGKGTGLGLATVYGAVKQHDGWVEVRSEPGAGSTFDVYLPLSTERREAVQTPAREGKAPGGQETVLVVEDEAAVRQLAVTILKSAGYTVLEAKNGLDAIGVMEREGGRVALVLTDLVMPGLISGIDLGEKLSAEYPGVKVVYTSGYSPDIVGGGAALKDKPFLSKPYTPPSLLRLIRNVLDGVLA
ncbi:MAG: ATP-binding protein [Verrucomicrobium sp.]|nr:ATP-binding protein [Verrucomicrobium sp.]